MKEMKTLTLNGEQYQITDALAARINDGVTGPDSTWSGEKITDALNSMQQAAVAGAVEAVEPRFLDIGETDSRQDEALQDLNEKVTGLIDDSSRAADKTLSSQFIHEMFNYTDQLHQTWLKTRVDDTATSADKTWSSQKLDGMFGEVESALDAVLAMQNELIGGDSV